MTVVTEVTEVGPRAKVAVSRGHYDDSLVDPQKKLVRKDKTSPPPFCSFLLLLSIPLGCDKSHREVPTRSRNDRVTQPWTSGLPNCEDPTTQAPWVLGLVQRPLDHCHPWALLLVDVPMFSLPWPSLPSCFTLSWDVTSRLLLFHGNSSVWI